MLDDVDKKQAARIDRKLTWVVSCINELQVELANCNGPNWDDLAWIEVQEAIEMIIAELQVPLEQSKNSVQRQKEICRNRNVIR